MRVAFDHSANAGVLRYLAPRAAAAGREAVTCAPSEVEYPTLRLGTHPDLVGRLWDELPVGIPEDCRYVVHGAPALVHPASGIVFGFAGGTSTYALRLPPRELAEALAAGAKRTYQYPGYPLIDLAELGEEWIFGGWFKNEEVWCLAAYLHAAPDEAARGEEAPGRPAPPIR